ncbi:MAG: DUF1573 domain-containing protein, partial [Planctomycetota bacterium]
MSHPMLAPFATRWLPLAGAVPALLLMLLSGCTEDPDTTAEPAAMPAQSSPAPSGASADRTKAAQTPDPALARPVRFEPAQLDLGILRPQQEVTSTFKVHNLGDKPLRILTLKPSCACTTVAPMATP